VADASDHTPYWVAKSMNAAGQVTDEYTRNGVETVSTRNPSTGWLMDATTTAVADNNTLIQKWTNTYDEAGNLRSRARSEPSNMADSVETFGYDLLDRLTLSEVKIPSESYDVPESFTYDSLGNLTQKGGQTYSYTGCGGRPHAVCQVGNTNYAYDANGNMTNASLPEVATGKLINYNSANKVINITNTPSVSNAATINTVAFIYGADGNRVVQSVGTAAQGESARTVYVGMGGTGKSVYERTTHGAAGATEHVQFLYAGGAHGGNAFALRVVTTPPTAGANSSSDSQDNPPPAMRYQHFDHLGSVTASTDENGRVVGALAGAQTTVLGYDAWGARRNPDGRPASTTLALQPGHREFTGHETIPDVGLVNMNGRVYDPELGRFLTPDPNVQFLANLQSYNRYSYAANNPLRYTDPTGYAWYSFLSSSSFWIGLGLGTLDAIACVGTGGAGCIAMTALTVYYQTSTMLVSGAPFDQVAATTLFGFGAGMVGGAIGGGIAGWLGANPAYQIVGGAIAGMVSGGLTTLAFGGSLGQNMLLGAASGALAAAAVWGAQGTNPVSQASADQSQGEGGGSGADRVQAAATGVADEDVREFGTSARDSIARENYQSAIANMDAAGELGGPLLGADGQPLRTAWTFQVTASVNINCGPVNINLSVGLAGDSNGGLALTRTGGGGAGVGAGGSAGVGWDVSNGASVDDLGGPFATTQTSAGLGPSASASGYTGKGSQGQQIAGNGWSVGAGAGGGTYTGGSLTKVWRLW
jgi:RHS repeat-associated protein